MSATTVPLPVAALLRRARNARAAKDRHDTAYFAWEASVVLAVVARPPADLTSLQRPSVGTWVANLSVGDQRLSDPALLAALGLLVEGGTGRRAAPKTVSPKEVLAALPAYRNAVVGHGSVRTEEFYDAAGPVLAAGLEAAWAQGIFLGPDERLTWAGTVEIDGEGRRRARLLDLTGELAHVVDPRGTPDVPAHLLPRRAYLRAGDDFRPLHPWVLCREEENRERVYLFAGLAGRPKWLDYVSGEALSGDALEKAFPGTESDALALFRERAGEGAGGAAGAGEQLGEYRVVKKLGEGGMGVVYLARQEGTDRLVALKTLPAGLMDDPTAVARFEREVKALSRCDHPNVVRILASGVARGARFYTMEYVEGQTLRSLLHELGRVPEELCLHIGREVARGLSAIHASGVVHRDVKPENVLITRDQVVKVMDLGAARLATESRRISGSGHFVGSVQYAAPEQFTDNAEVDGRTDLHALGITLYELATGQNPYAGEDVRKTLHRVLYEAPRRCAELNPQLSPFFEEAVHALLAKKPQDRFASAADLARVLEEGEASRWWTDRAKAIRVATKRPLRRIRIPSETALYGREGEIARLRALYEKAKAGQGQVVLIEGEAGIGKSRLVDEFVGLLQREGEDLNFLHGSYPPAGAATASGAFSTAYREHFGAEGLEETLKPYLPETAILVPAFAALLLGSNPPPGVEALTKDSMQTVFVKATRGLAAERPTIVLIDDLHFAPEEGRALLAALAMSVPGHRILLVGTTRPGLDEKWLAHFDRTGAARIALGRLGPKDLSRLLVEALHSEHLAQELSYRIGAKSDGNPFFVFEILRGLREGNYLTQTADGTWVPTRVIADITIPSSILELVQGRVADLDDAERNMLDVASCVGFEFDPLVVAQVLSLGKIPAMQALARIEKRHRLVRSSGRRFVFDQHQVQEAFYTGLPEILREEYHAAIAEAMEAQGNATVKDPKTLDGGLCQDLADHFFKGNRPDRALRYLDAALAHLDRSWLSDTAIQMADRALAVPGLLEGRDRCVALIRNARRMDLRGRSEDEEKALLEAVALADEAGDPGLRARARNEVGDLLRRRGRATEAERHLEEALAIQREIGDRAGESLCTLNLGIVRLNLGRLEEARALQERAVSLAQECGMRQTEATAIVNLGNVSWYLGRLEEARAHYERAIPICREVKDRAVEVQAELNVGLASQSLGRLDEARLHFERVLAQSREIGFRPAEANAAGCLGVLLSCLGRHEEARIHLERYLAMNREFGDRLGEAGALLHLGQVVAELGRTEEARTHIEGALSVARGIRARSAEAEALLQLAVLRATTPQREQAQPLLAEALAIAEETPLPGVRLLACAQRAALAGGDSKEDLATALRMLAECEGQAGIQEAMGARFLLWKATGDVAHLREAKRRLDGLLERIPAEARAGLAGNVRLHREILAAAGEAGV